MGMFDHVTFRHTMPDGYYEADSYQTKDLRYAMDMALYEVDASGRLIRTTSDFGQPLGDVRYNHTLTIAAPGHGYALVFGYGSLREIHCFQTGRTVPFERRTGQQSRVQPR